MYHDLRYPNHRPHTIGVSDFLGYSWMTRRSVSEIKFSGMCPREDCRFDGEIQTIRFDGYMKCSLQGHYIRLIHGEGGVHIWSFYLSVYSPVSCQGIKYTCPTSAPSTLLETDESGYYFLPCKSYKCLHMPTWHAKAASSPHTLLTLLQKRARLSYKFQENLLLV